MSLSLKGALKHKEKIDCPAMAHSYVFDSSVVIAIINREKGADRAAEYAPDAFISAVNYSEVVSTLVDWGYGSDIIDHVLREFNLQSVDFDAPQAITAGLLRAITRTKGLSLGDRACLALAKSTGRIAVTADRAWAELDIGVEIELIR